MQNYILKDILLQYHSTTHLQATRNNYKGTTTKKVLD